MATLHPDPFPLDTFKQATFDPEQARESICGRITLAASVTFFAVVMFYLAIASRAEDSVWLHVREAMQSILPAVTSVLGTVLGFYFGSQKR